MLDKPAGKFVNSRLNGFLLLLTFGLFCGVIAGTVFGFGFAVYIQFLPRKSNDIQLWLIFSGVGALFGLVPGMIYGLLSYYFTSRLHWLLAGGLCGFVPGIFLTAAFGFNLQGWLILLVCMSYGVLVGYINFRYSTWWGMRLRAEAIELLRPNT